MGRLKKKAGRTWGTPNEPDAGGEYGETFDIRYGKEGYPKNDRTSVTADRMMGILNKNKDRNFVKRLLKPEDYPVQRNGPGSYSSHLMSDSSDLEGGFAYPNITQDPKTKRLVRRDGADAAKYAKDSGELIRFDTPEEASDFARHYKSIWGAKDE